MLKLLLLVAAVWTPAALARSRGAGTCYWGRNQPMTTMGGSSIMPTDGYAIWAPEWYEQGDVVGVSLMQEMADAGGDPYHGILLHATMADDVSEYDYMNHPETTWAGDMNGMRMPGWVTPLPAGTQFMDGSVSGVPNCYNTAGETITHSNAADKWYTEFWFDTSNYWDDIRFNAIMSNHRMFTPLSHYMRLAPAECCFNHFEYYATYYCMYSYYWDLYAWGMLGPEHLEALYELLEQINWAWSSVQTCAPWPVNSDPPMSTHTYCCLDMATEYASLWCKYDYWMEKYNSQTLEADDWEDLVNWQAMIWDAITATQSCWS